jgi:hypothetical protein
MMPARREPAFRARGPPSLPALSALCALSRAVRGAVSRHLALRAFAGVRTLADANAGEVRATAGTYIGSAGAQSCRAFLTYPVGTAELSRHAFRDVHAVCECAAWELSGSVG